jgi:hypothetical protein
LAEYTHDSMGKDLRKIIQKSRENNLSLKNVDDKLNGVNEQLAEKATKLELQAVASGSPKGAYSTLTELQSAFPAGDLGIYVVSADGNWYYWDGSTWAVGGQYLTTQFVSALTTQDEPWEVV